MKHRAPDPRTARTRAAILDATSELLTEEGSSHVSIARIAKRAGISVGSVYLHFEHKDELVTQLIAVAWDRHADRFAAARSSSSPLDRLAAFGATFLAFARDEPVAYRELALREIEAPSPSRVPRPSGLHQHQALLRADVAAAIDQGDLSSGSVDATYAYLLGAWRGIAAELVRSDSPAGTDLDALETLARTALLSGLGAGVIAG
jgi:AcrR family transcriptional regulator